MREITVFSCNVRILKIHWPEMQNPIIRDRQRNICKDTSVSTTTNARAISPKSSTLSRNMISHVSTSSVKEISVSTTSTSPKSTILSRIVSRASTPSVKDTSVSTTNARVISPKLSTLSWIMISHVSTPSVKETTTKTSTNARGISPKSSVILSQIGNHVSTPSVKVGSHDDEDDDIFDVPTAKGFLAWAVTSTMAIILLIIKRYLIKTFRTCPCTHRRRNGYDTTAESREHVPLSDMPTLPPVGETPNVTRPIPMDTPYQSAPDVSACFSTPQSNLSPEIPSTPSSTKPLLDAPAYNTRSQGKVLFI
uniref:Hyphal wall protein 1-like isoform X3 n=1 Tax=Crassostrea virginica TaxID=6565 RepID=A0A8B8C6G9_CRAVI|nr:hyphal wall protein 1-like isoform X3 [Crassostrea virginica]